MTRFLLMETQINNLLLTIAEAVFAVLLFSPGWM